MDPRELAYADWLQGVKYRVIAEKHGVSLSAVKSWAVRDWKSRAVAAKGMKKSQPAGRKSQPKGKTAPVTDSIDKKLAEAVEENGELTAKQKEFCLRFVRTCNAAQSYVRVYGCTYASALRAASRLLTKVDVQAEIKALRIIKNSAIGGVSGDDIVELHMRIAFADINDYVEFETKRVPVMSKGEVVMMEHPKTKERIPVTQAVNTVKLRSNAKVDGQIISEVSEGREGARLKLADKTRSLAFLERYFELNPMDRHRKEYDDKRYELELIRVEADQQLLHDGDNGSSSNFLEAMMGVVDDVWRDEAEPGSEEDENTNSGKDE